MEVLLRRSCTLLPWLAVALFSLLSCEQAALSKDGAPPDSSTVNSRQTLLKVEPPLKVIFESHGDKLVGYVYKPAGEGPFPAVVWNHGSYDQKKAGAPGHYSKLAEFYTQHGFVLFLPFRHGSHISPDFPAATSNGMSAIQHQELLNDDVVSAFKFLKSVSYIEAEHIALSGVSVGGIQTLLTAEKNPGACGFVAFAPGAMSWQLEDVRKRLIEAVLHSRGPIFLIQANNDFSTGPYDVLGPLIRAKGYPNTAKLYSPYGRSHFDGHHFFAVEGSDIWGKDVLKFLGECMKIHQ